MPDITFIRAINQALMDEMRRDERVMVVGEDVAEGGPYGATRDLAEEFGVRRVRNTPISESAVTGLCVGLALSGMRPVLEIMFIDFITLALDQLVNQAAKTRYMSGGQLSCPLVLRTQGGAGVRSGAQHSQSLEAWLLHVPGLRVVMPSNPADAAGLLKTAIRSDDPVVMVENKAIYYRRLPVPDELPAVPMGSATVCRRGRDATVLATSRLVGEALDAAEALARDGVEIEVIDPRSLRPFDTETLLESVARTHRLVVAHEAVVEYGFGAEIAAMVQERALDRLEAPVLRVGAPFVPVPTSAVLEDLYLPGKEEIATAVRETLRW